MKKTLIFMVLAVAMQFAIAGNVQDYTLCSDCGFYHGEDELCDDVKESGDGKYFDTNGAKKVKFKPFEAIDAFNGIHVTIIEGEEEFIMVNGNAGVMAGFSCRNRKSLLVISAKNTYRDNTVGQDSTLCHVLISRRADHPIKKIRARVGSIVHFPQTVKYDQLTIEAFTGSKVSIDAQVKELRCIAKSVSMININSKCDSIMAIAESVSNINVEGDVRAISVNSSFGSKINLKVDAVRVHAIAFYGSAVTAEGKCRALTAESNESSVCDMSNLDADKVYGYAYNMSEVHINATKKLSTIAEKMSLIHIYELKKGKPVFVTNDEGEQVREKKISTTGISVNK